MDDKWSYGLGSLHTKSNINEAEAIKSYYIKKMKVNKVVVESSIIAVEPSTLYYDNGYCMRVQLSWYPAIKRMDGR